MDEEDQVSDDDVNYEIGPGMVNMLGPGEGVEIADAKRPSSNFDAFTTSLANISAPPWKYRLNFS